MLGRRFIGAFRFSQKLVLLSHLAAANEALLFPALAE